MRVLTRDRVAVLLGFAKVMLLDRAAAEDCTRGLLLGAPDTDDDFDLLRSLALRCYARVPEPSPALRENCDPLSDPLLRDISVRERAELFLTLRCGLPASVASVVAAPGRSLPHAA